MTAAEQVELFDIPAAYQQSAWRYVPNGQDVCAVVELDEVTAGGEES